jgi:hypothetical protein
MSQESKRPTRRTKLYVGRAHGRPEVFRSATEPSEATHGALYFAVVGPFRTRAAAYLDARTYPNPHIQCVADAERIIRYRKGGVQ